MDYKELNRVIESSGLKPSYIAGKLGMSDKVFYDRRTGRSQWRIEEVRTFASIMNLTKKQRDDIFLPEK